MVACQSALGIAPGATWESHSPEYREALEIRKKRQYRRAIDELERLVLQRLMELKKMNLSGTGEVFSS